MINIKVIFQLDKDSDGMINYQEFCDIVGKNDSSLSQHTYFKMEDGLKTEKDEDGQKQTALQTS